MQYNNDNLSYWLCALFIVKKNLCEFKYHRVKILKITEMKQTVKKQMYSMIVSVIVCIFISIKMV